MFSLVKKSPHSEAAEPQRAKVSQRSMGEDLQFIAQHGKAWLSNMGSGWACSCDMESKPYGVKMEVCSNRGLSTPEEAAAQCADRLRDALRAMGATL
jgi:RNA 3'-terminal phosphate cyclase